MAIDPKTGREFGDHGSANEAIDFALDHEGTGMTWEFLKSWRQGDLEEWPEYYAFLEERAGK